VDQTASHVKHQESATPDDQQKQRDYKEMVQISWYSSATLTILARR